MVFLDISNFNSQIFFRVCMVNKEITDEAEMPKTEVVIRFCIMEV